MFFWDTRINIGFKFHVSTVTCTRPWHSGLRGPSQSYVSFIVLSLTLTFLSSTRPSTQGQGSTLRLRPEGQDQGQCYEADARILASRLNRWYWLRPGERKNVGPDDAKILTLKAKRKCKPKIVSVLWNKCRPAVNNCLLTRSDMLCVCRTVSGEATGGGRLNPPLVSRTTREICTNRWGFSRGGTPSNRLRQIVVYDNFTVNFRLICKYLWVKWLSGPLIRP